MKKLFLLAFFFPLCLLSQEDAWVFFTDKPEAAYYLANPSEMLSDRALQRRASQGIALDFLDVPIHLPYVEQVRSSPGISVMASSKWLNSVHVRGSVSDVQQLAGLPFVLQITFARKSLNPELRIAGSRQNNRTASAQVDFPYGGSANQIEMLNGHVLHQMNHTGAGKLIAVLDAGFPGVDVADAFQRLRDNNLIEGVYNFVQDSENVFTMNSHGTLVLSAMGAYLPESLVGTAPDASYLLYVTEDASSENPVEESYWVAAAEEADRMGADIINTSLGYFHFDDTGYNYSYEDLDGNTSFISRGADIAASRGMVVVVSAGNSGNTGNPHVTMPGDAQNVLTVGAVDGNGSYAGFSSVGPTSDGRIKPDVMAKGASATVAGPNGSVTTVNGTSISSPIIAGLIAGFWSAQPSLTSTEVIQAIKESAHLFETPDNVMGYGIPDFAAALENLSRNEVDAASVCIFPNPVYTHATIKLPGDAVSELLIFDSLGRNILKCPIFDGATIDLSDFGAGTYFYKVFGQNQTVSGRLIKL